jgi:hypothetical protein
MLPIKSVKEFKDFVANADPEMKKPLTPQEVDVLVKMLQEAAGSKK